MKDVPRPREHSALWPRPGRGRERLLEAGHVHTGVVEAVAGDGLAVQTAEPGLHRAALTQPLNLLQILHGQAVSGEVDWLEVL